MWLQGPHKGATKEKIVEVKKLGILCQKDGFCRAMLSSSTAYAIMHCPSVCLSVSPSITFIHSVKSTKDIFKIFSLSGSPTILVFQYQMAWQYPDGNPLTVASNAGGVG